MLTKKRKRKESGIFVEKLFNLLGENQKYIHWDKEGKIVVISDKDKLEKILPQKFNHDKFSSFVRQLNIYGFKKIINIENSTEEQYFNENFNKNKNINEIRNIERNDTYYDNIRLKRIQLKEQKIILDEIDNENNNEKKIEKYKKLVNNGNIHIYSKIHLLKFLLEKKKDRIIFDEKLRAQISELKNTNNAKIQKIINLNEKIDNETNKYEKIINISNSLIKDENINNDVNYNDNEYKINYFKNIFDANILKQSIDPNIIKQSIDSKILKISINSNNLLKSSDSSSLRNSSDSFLFNGDEKFLKMFKNFQKEEKYNDNEIRLSENINNDFSNCIGNPKNDFENPINSSYNNISKNGSLIGP